MPTRWRAPVDLEDDPGAGGAFGHFGENLIRVLRTRVVAGEDRQIGCCRSAAHQWPFLAIRSPPAPTTAITLARRDRSGYGCCLFDPVGEVWA